MTDVRIRLDDEETARLDQYRGTLSRPAWFREFVTSGQPDPDSQIEEALRAGVYRATQAYRDHHPGYGAYLLTRLAMDVQRMEVGR